MTWPGAGSVGLEAGRCLAAAGSLALHLDANPRVLPADDIPIGGWLLLRGEAEDGLEGDVPIKASVVAEDELVEVGGDMLRAQAVVGAEAPALQEGENPMNPSEGDMSCHTADDTRVVAVAFQS